MQNKIKLELISSFSFLQKKIFKYNKLNINKKYNLLRKVLHKLFLITILFSFFSNFSFAENSCEQGCLIKD
jgi:hypothetical protein